jgi:hypothetical protein
MLTQRLDELRIFYNHTIHPELMRLERLRRRFLLTLLFGSLGILLLIALDALFGMFLLTLILVLPIIFIINGALQQLRTFRTTFKPQIVNLVLDFIDNDYMFTEDLSYIQDASIDPKIFRDSLLFTPKIDPKYDYIGEDYITGKIGEMDFELSELSIKVQSAVRNRLDDVFRGVFLHTKFKHEVPGDLLMLPRKQKQFLTRAIKNATKQFWKEDKKAMSEAFLAEFIVYANELARPEQFLTPEMQASLLQYRQQTGKELYLSFISDHICIAVSQPKDLLEPQIFRSNISFDLVREFYEDLMLVMSIILDIDANN